MKTTQSQQILITLAARPDKEFTAPEIVDALSIPVASAGTLLSDMAHAGRIVRTERGQYKAGPATLEEAVALIQRARSEYHYVPTAESRVQVQRERAAARQTPRYTQAAASVKLSKLRGRKPQRGIDF